MNVYMNLWGVLCTDPPVVGSTVEVTTKNGKVRRERIAGLIGKSADGKWICATGEPWNFSSDDVAARERRDAVRIRALGEVIREKDAEIAELTTALASTATAGTPATCTD